MKFFWLAICGMILMPVGGCLQKKYDNQRSDGTSWAVRESIRLDRAASRVSANLKFKTSKAALCELSIWSTDKAIVPSADKPLVQPCKATGTTGATDFDEEIKDLRSDTYYAVKVNMWVDGDKKTVGSFLIEEGAGIAGAINGRDEASRKLSSVVVARVDIPLRGAEVHKNLLGTAKTPSAVREAMIRKPGCQSPAPMDAGVYSKSSGDLPVIGLSTRGYATGQAVQQPSAIDRLRLDFNTLQEGTNWEWVFVADKSDVSFFSYAPSRLQSIDMTAATTSRFSDQVLTGQESAVLPITAQQPLKFSWKADRAGPGTRLVARIGEPGTPKSIQCVYDATAESGDVDAPLVAGLPVGTYTVHVDLEYPQIQLFPGTKRPAWVIISHDWRSGVVQKL